MPLAFRPSLMLREWRPSDYARQKDATAKIRFISGGAGEKSRAFEKACHAIYNKSRGNEAALSALLKTPLYVRAYCYLLATDSDFANTCFPSSSIFQAMESTRWPLSRLTLSYLVRVFFIHYEAGQGAKTTMLADFLRRAVATLPAAVTGEFALWKKHASKLFHFDAPQIVVAGASEQQADFDIYLARIGLKNHRASDFVKACYRMYYIRQLETMPVGEDNPLLSELLKPEVHNAIYDQSRLIGHRALEILIDRSPNAGASDVWQRAVLSIAGDPRVGRQAVRYKKWWQLLGNDRARKVVGWLSRLDLKIFLETLEACAREEGDEAIQTMYPPRKIFMEGLLEQGLVLQSRLFLSRQASLYLRRNYDPKDIPEYAHIESGYTSMIYLELTSGLHMIEGTHNFKLKILDSLPATVNLTHFDKRRYADRNLRTEIMSHYFLEAKREGRRVEENKHYIDQVHRGPVAWQAAAIALFKEKSVPYEAAKLFSKESYRIFKQNYSHRYLR